jgi:hypothetical protein
MRGTVSRRAVIGALLVLVAGGAWGHIQFHDCYGSTAETFDARWRFTIQSPSNGYLGIRIMDPTWGWTKPNEDAASNRQSLATFQAVPGIPFDSTRVDAEHGHVWFFFHAPPSTFHIDVRVSGTAGATTTGLAMHDYRDPNNAWCAQTDNIIPADWVDLAQQIEAELDSGSLCGNEGLIQACAAYAGGTYSNCRDAAICMAGLLRSAGIPASVDITYQMPGSGNFGGVATTVLGGLHAQVSAWNWSSGEWERCDPAYSAGFVHPADVKIGGVLDPDHLTPLLEYEPGDPEPDLTVQHVSGGYAGNVAFQSIQFRDDDVLELSRHLATLCFATYGCGKHETMPVPPPDALTGVGAASIGPARAPLRLLGNPCRGSVGFHAPERVRLDLFSVSGRLLQTLSGKGELRADLPPGVYLYRATGYGGEDTRGKFVVLR